MVNPSKWISRFNVGFEMEYPYQFILRFNHFIAVEAA